MLVIMGATPEGKKELVGLLDGERESKISWKELFLDLKRRGLKEGPLLAVADGALGAIDQHGHRFSAERLAALLREHIEASPPQLIRAVVRAVMHFTDDAPLTDDLTALALHFNGP